MKKRDLASLALLGLTSGMLVGCQASGTLPSSGSNSNHANGNNAQANGSNFADGDNIDTTEGRTYANGYNRTDNGNQQSAGDNNRLKGSGKYASQGAMPQPSGMPMTQEEQQFYSKLNRQGQETFKSMNTEERAMVMKMMQADCKGHNECKGLGSCKTDSHDCAGKNDCKGQGGCKVTDPNKAVELVESHMSERRESMIDDQSSTPTRSSTPASSSQRSPSPSSNANSSSQGNSSNPRSSSSSDKDWQ